MCAHLVSVSWALASPLQTLHCLFLLSLGVLTGLDSWLLPFLPPPWFWSAICPRLLMRGARCGEKVVSSEQR